MGGCCSQAVGRPLTRSETQSITVSEQDLRARTPSRSLSTQEVDALLGAYQDLAYRSYLRKLELALTDDTVLDSREFAALLQEAKGAAKNYFRSLFVQGSPGESVPLDVILAAEVALSRLCDQDTDLFTYCNNYRSFLRCSAAKRRVVEDYLFRGEVSKSKLLRVYDSAAAGPYFTLCRNDLEILISKYPKADRACTLSELKKQSVADREILRRDRSKAEALSQRPVPEGFCSGKDTACAAGGESYEAMNARISVLDLIARIPDEDELAENSSQGYFTLQGEVVAKGPIKKNKTTGDRPRPEPILSSASCTSQKVSKVSIILEDAEEGSN